MLPTFIIGLREGLEAALIVGIVAAFLGQQGRRDALRQVWIGTTAAVVLCLAIGIGLDRLDRELPQRQQEGLETIIGAIAVCFVSYMVLWMRRHARDLKGDLEGHAAGALASGSSRALVTMAFLAVLREGFETAVFLLATFQNSTDKTAGGLGALLGIVVAVVLGALVFRGGLKIDLNRFFRVTGVVLVVIAAGLVLGAFRTGHEAGWVTFGQGSTWDLDWLVHKGTPVESLVTGVLGIPQRPVAIEVVAYVAYLVPMLALVLWPARRRPSRPADPAASADDQADPVPASSSSSSSARRQRVALALLLPAAGLLATSCAKSDETAAGAGAVQVEITDAGCPPSPTEVPAGKVSFAVTNVGSAKATEAELTTADGNEILGEKENLTEGLRGTFTVNLQEGSYRMYCPGADQERWDFTVTAGAKAARWQDDPKLVAAVDGYATYVSDQVTELVAATSTFTDAVRAGDVDGAKAAYGAARAPYERIAPVAEAAGDLAPAIAGRADEGTDPADLTGFHRLEHALWVDGSVDGLADVADQLDADVAALAQQVADLGGGYVPEAVAEGATDLVADVLDGAIPGAEERWAHTDLLDLQARVDGALQVVELLRPALADSTPELVAKIDGKAQELQEGLDGYQADPGHEGTGYVEWGTAGDPDAEVDDDQRTELAALVQPLVDLLDELPVKVAS